MPELIFVLVSALGAGVLALVAFDVLAIRFGADSRDRTLDDYRR